MKITSASVAAAGLALLPAAAVADNNNLHCSRQTVNNKQGPYTTTATIHGTAYPWTTLTNHPVTTYTPMTTITRAYPTVGVGKVKPKTVVTTQIISTEIDTSIVVDTKTVRADTQAYEAFD